MADIGPSLLATAGGRYSVDHAGADDEWAVSTASALLAHRSERALPDQPMTVRPHDHEPAVLALLDRQFGCGWISETPLDHDCGRRLENGAT